MGAAAALEFGVAACLDGHFVGDGGGGSSAPAALPLSKLAMKSSDHIKDKVFWGIGCCRSSSFWLVCSSFLEGGK